MELVRTSNLEQDDVFLTKIWNGGNAAEKKEVVLHIGKIKKGNYPCILNSGKNRKTLQILREKHDF